MTPTPPVPPPLWRIGLCGAIALAVAMGIGRFAFTPLMPLMQQDGLLDGRSGAWLAAANYLGYLVGALTAARLPGSVRAQVLGSLLATAALTAGVGAVTGLAAWLPLRLAAGVASAWTLVATSGWAVSALTRQGRGDAAGWVFAGVGLGIATAGGWTWWHGAHGALALWRELGALALALAAGVALGWPGPRERPAAAPAALPPATPARGQAALVLCYGVFGFGYILPATYLPALARQLIADPDRFGLVWPVFGLAAAASTLLAGRAQRRWDGRRVWAASHALMAVGCALPLVGRGAATITLAAVLVGGTFMVATMTGLQEARRLAPQNPRPLLGRMTAAFALGQIAGPLLALALDQALAARPAGVPALRGVDGVALAQGLAAASLLASAAWLHRATTPGAAPLPHHPSPDSLPPTQELSRDPSPSGRPH